MIIVMMLPYLFGFLQIISFALANKYIITPISNSSCPQLMEEPCFTLTHLAGDQFPQNTTLALLPGIHYLQTELLIANISIVMITAAADGSDQNEGSSKVTLVFTNNAKLIIRNISSVAINGIMFLPNNSNVSLIKTENQFYLLLILQSVITAKLNALSFTGVLNIHNSYIEITESVFGNHNIMGHCNSPSTVNAFNSTLTLSNTCFTKTKSAWGKAIFATKCVITMIKCAIKDRQNNESTVTIKESEMLIVNSSFVNNTAWGEDSGGGALFFSNSNVTIKSSVFSNNSANGSGGAIYSKFRTLLITKCVFNDNRAIQGGAIYTSSNLFTLTDSLLQGNIANRNHGGAMMIHYTMNLKNTTRQMTVFFYSHTMSCNTNSVNTAYYNPYECSVENSSILLLRNSFIGNLAMRQGGAICVFTSIISKYQLHYHVSVAIVDNIFFRNKVGTAGGAISIMPFANAIILNSTFVENSAASIPVRTCKGGGLYQHHSSTIEIVNSKFLGNNASHYGAAIHSTSSSETLLEIKNCSFTENVVNKSGGAIYILSFGVNKISAMITESKFSSNKASVDGGAIYIWSWNCTIEIFNTMFNANEAMTGGALYIDNTTVAMADTTFTHNVVMKDAYGGAAYAIGSKVYAENLTVFKNVGYHGVFYMANSVLLVSGITKIANNSGSIYAFYSNVTFGGNTAFEFNSAGSDSNVDKLSLQEGGAITAIQSNIIFIETTLFRFNKAELGGAMKLMDRSKVFLNHNITIALNTALLSGGGIFSDQSELNIRGNCTFTSNDALLKGGGVYSSSSTLTLFEGSLLFEYNRAELGGALSSSSTAKLFIIKERTECERKIAKICDDYGSDFHNWLRLEFNNNSARYGGAIHVNDQENYDTCESGSSQNESAEPINCFMQILAFHSAQNTVADRKNGWYFNTVNTFFYNNSASVAGTNLYGGLLDRCSISPFSELFLKDRSVSSNALTHILNTTNIKLNSIASGPVQMWFCKGNQPDSNYVPSILVKKGNRFTLSVVAIDQINNMVPATIHSYVLSDSSRLHEGQAIQNVTRNCTLIHFNMFSTKDSETLYLHANGPCSGIGISRRGIVVAFEPCTCPIGFQQTSREDECECQCHPSLSRYITKCRASNSSLLRQGGFWITYSNSTNKTGFVIYDYCPFDYCHPSTTDTYINLNIPNGADAQCAFNRSGVLCGSCMKGLSLCFGSSRCLPCSNNWLALIIPFALAGIALVVFLLVFNLTVAVGTLNGLVVYANIVIVNRSVLFPFSEPNANFIIIFISWINLDLGIETCFYNGMDAYSRTWLQLVFPAYLISLLIVVIILSERSSQFAKLLSGRNPVATLMSVIVISYTKVLRMIIDAVAVANIHYPDSVRRVWLADGNIKYLQGKHIPLFVVALLIIIVGILYTFLRFSFQWLLQCSGKYWFLRFIANPKLQSIMDVYHAPFNPKHRYWSGLLLLVRVILYVVSAANTHGDPNANLIAIVITITGLVILKSWMGGKIYKHWILNLLEDAFLINIIVFSALTFYVRYSNGDQLPIAYILPGIAIAISFGILIYHLFAFVLKGTWITRKLTFVISKLNVKVMKIKLKDCNVHTNEEDSEEFETSLGFLLRQDTTTADYKLLEYPKTKHKPTSTVVEVDT